VLQCNTVMYVCVCVCIYVYVWIALNYILLRVHFKTYSGIWNMLIVQIQWFWSFIVESFGYCYVLFYSEMNQRIALSVFFTCYIFLLPNPLSLFFWLHGSCLSAYLSVTYVHTCSDDTGYSVLVMNVCTSQMLTPVTFLHSGKEWLLKQRIWQLSHTW
jgi:hypothetical protein